MAAVVPVVVVHQPTIDPKGDYAQRVKRSSGNVAKVNRNPAGCDTKDGVKKSQRCASFLISFGMGLTVAALFMDEWIEVKDPNFFVGWPGIGLNGTASTIQFGLRNFCGVYREGTGTDGDPFIGKGKSCQRYGEYMDATFGLTPDDGNLARVFKKSDVVFLMSTTVWALWAAFAMQFIGALFSEKKCCTACLSIVICLFLACALTVGPITKRWIIQDLGDEVEFQYLIGWNLCLCAFLTAVMMTTCTLIACGYTSADEFDTLEEVGDDGAEQSAMQTRNFTEFGLMNDQIELVGRFGAALGQLGWLLILIALMDAEWAHIDTVGCKSMGQYGLENATTGTLGLNQWCIGGIDVLVPDIEEEDKTVYGKDRLCFRYEDTFGVDGAGACKIFQEIDLCTKKSTATSALFAGGVIGFFADLFSEKMPVQAALQWIACALAVLSLTTMASAFHSDKATEILGSELTDGRAIYTVMGSVFCYFFGGVCCFLDHQNVCRTEGAYGDGDAKTAGKQTCLKKCCVCWSAGHNDLYDINGTETNHGGQCEWCYGNVRTRGK